MKKFKFLSMLLTLMLALSVVLTACAGTQEEKKTGEDEKKEPAFKVAMVTDTGGVNDNSFNESAWEGLTRLKDELGHEVSYLESKADDQYQPNLTSLIRKGNNLVWGIGFLMATDVEEIAKANADAKLAIVDFVYENIPANVASVAFDEHEGSFLVGLIAGHMTKTNKVGFLGGVEFDLIKKFEYGFKAGVLAANPNAEIITNYAGDFGRPDLGQQFASTMYSQGADIIYHASGGTGNGVFEEAKQLKAKGKDVWVIGVDKDQSFLGEDVTLTSMVKRVDNAVYQITKMAAEGNFPGGTATTFGLKQDGVGIAPTQTHLTEEVLKMVNEYKEKIINGEIKVPKNEEEFKAHTGK